MPIRRFRMPSALLSGLMFLLALSPLAQPDEGGSVLAVSAYNIVNDRSQILLLSVGPDDAVDRLHEVLLPLDSGIVAYSYGVSLSPDARQLVYPAIMRDGPDQLYIYDVETGQNTILIDDPENAYADPVFSPDGTQIAFTLTASGADESDIYIINADGSGLTPITETPDVPENRLAWSPDGQSLAYIAADEPDYQIYVVPVDGGEPRLIDESGDAYPTRSDIAWAADGQRLYFVSQTQDELGTAVYSIALDDSGEPATVYDPTGITDTAPGIDWLNASSDETRLAFAATEYGLSDTGTMTARSTVRIVSLESGEVDILTWDFGTAFITGLDWREPQ